MLIPAIFTATRKCADRMQPLYVGVWVVPLSFLHRGFTSLRMSFSGSRTKVGLRGAAGA